METMPLATLPRADEGRINITIAGLNADLPDTVAWDATDADIKGWVTEALRAGSVPGIPAQPNVNLADFVVDRFQANEARPYNSLMIRPKTPFGF